MVIAACLTPLCWLGSPADFWFVAVGALVSTVVGCTMVLVQEGMDVADHESCYYNVSNPNDTWHAHYPAPESALGFGKGILYFVNKIIAILHLNG